MLLHFTSALWNNKSGATAIEYSLIAGGIALVIVAAVGLIGGSLDNFFTNLSTNL
ncbi:MAG: Flp family type IVb pilin [Rhodospirillaceae bacterium]|jgi:pilus assembly protein Flp/PilA|nr:Flp family type IVb pilin [Rhodospirillaceae bacterium]MBT5751695.1 Flp family type IVb pilin [Rhodospirillaceae bacterium]